MDPAVGHDQIARSAVTPVASEPLSTWDTANWRVQAIALPNLLTYVRIIAVPVFVWAFLAGRSTLALVLFAMAAVTDGLDGLLARALHMQTRLGTLLDPIADKLLTLAALVLLVARGELPAWLLGMVLVRDGGIALGTAHLRASRILVPSTPTRFGKYATFTLLSTITLALVRMVHRSAVLDGYIVAGGILALVCVTVTIIQYGRRWRRLLRAQ